MGVVIRKEKKIYQLTKEEMTAYLMLKKWMMTGIKVDDEIYYRADVLFEHFRKKYRVPAGRVLCAKTGQFLAPTKQQIQAVLKERGYSFVPLRDEKKEPWEVKL